MNKADLISAVAAESGLSKADAKKAVEGVVSAVSNALPLKHMKDELKLDILID